MNKYFFIILKLLKINFKDFFFLSFNSIYSAIITSLTVVFVLITLSINLSFKEIIKTKIIKHDGYAHTYTNSLSFQKNNNFKEIFKISPFISKEVVVRNKSKTEACYLKFTDYDLDVFNLSDVIVKGGVNKKGLIIGSKLFSKLDLEINDDLNIIYEADGVFNVFKLPIVAVFKTSILDFDKYNIYCDFSIKQNMIFDSSESFVLNFKNFNNFDFSYELLENNSNYYFWYEKYESFLFWLNTYDYPINLLLFFILVVSSVNIVSSFYIDSMYRIKDLNLFRILGLNNKSICLILCLRYSIIVFFGCVLGIIFIYSIQHLQNTFHILSIPEYVYFMKYLPISVNIIHCIILSSFLVLLSFILNLFIYQLTIKKHVRILN